MIMNVCHGAVVRGLVNALRNEEPFKENFTITHYTLQTDELFCIHLHTEYNHLSVDPLVACITRVKKLWEGEIQSMFLTNGNMRIEGIFQPSDCAPLATPPASENHVCCTHTYLVDNVVNVVIFVCCCYLLRMFCV